MSSPWLVSKLLLGGEGGSCGGEREGLERAGWAASGKSRCARQAAAAGCCEYNEGMRCGSPPCAPQLAPVQGRKKRSVEYVAIKSTDRDQKGRVLQEVRGPGGGIQVVDWGYAVLRLNHNAGDGSTADWPAALCCPWCRLR